MYQSIWPHRVADEPPASPRHPGRSGQRRPHGWLALAAFVALAACGEDAEPAAKAEDPVAPPAPLATSTADWKPLADGSFVRTTAGVIADRTEADRCWPIAGGFDCLSLDAIAAPTTIVVATRLLTRAYAEVPVFPPEIGFSCAIYPSGLIEQRLLRAEAERLQNDDSDGSLWSAADVARLSATAGGERAPFVDCTALAARLSGASVGALADGDFERGAVMPPA
jgi:hypothetical protein